MRVYFSNLGCKLNQAEVDALARRFSARGHDVVGRLEEADLHVVNSCTVTHLAARDSRKVARRGARTRPGLRTVLTGCFATHESAVAQALEGVDLVVPNTDKDRLVELVREAFPELRDGVEVARGVPVSYVPLAFGPTRGLVKIEDGCNMRCAFCIIPTTRGRQRSRPRSEVVEEVRAMEAAGYREIVVTGVQISSYRDGSAGLCELVESLLEATSSCRFRLTSIAPWQFDPALLPLLSEPRICRHVHLSLQSGCDTVLRRMRRPYTAEGFANLVGRLREAVPGVAVTSDVIVGFPGESEDEFEDSLEFVDGLGLARTHAFTFSTRPGTEAAELPDQVPVPEKKARMARLLGVAAAGESHFRNRNLGGEVSVLWEEKREGRWSGMTDNYLRVFADSEEDLGGTLAPATLVAATAGGVLGSLT